MRFAILDQIWGELYCNFLSFKHINIDLPIINGNYLFLTLIVTRERYITVSWTCFICVTLYCAFQGSVLQVILVMHIYNYQRYCHPGNSGNAPLHLPEVLPFLIVCRCARRPLSLFVSRCTRRPLSLIVSRCTRRPMVLWQDAKCAVNDIKNGVMQISYQHHYCV